jgi:hypothetical protein
VSAPIVNDDALEGFKRRMFLVVENHRQYCRSPPLQSSVLRLVYEFAATNSSFNPTVLSLPFINIVPCDVGCAISSSGGSIRAFDGFLFYLSEGVLR